MTTRSKFTKSVKVGRSVYNPDELNRVAADFRRYIRNANKRKEAAIFYYRVESVNALGTVRKVNFWAVKRGQIVRLNYDIAALSGHKVDKEDRVILRGGTDADSVIRAIFQAIDLEPYRLRYPNGGTASAYSVVAI